MDWPIVQNLLSVELQSFLMFFIWHIVDNCVLYSSRPGVG